MPMPSGSGTWILAKIARDFSPGEAADQDLRRDGQRYLV